MNYRLPIISYILRERYNVLSKNYRSLEGYTDNEPWFPDRDLDYTDWDWYVDTYEDEPSN
jgi:hypothetical protein